MNREWTPEVLDVILRSRGKRIKRMREELEQARTGEEPEKKVRMSDMELFRKMGINTRPN